jgi:cation transport ATPase
MTDHERHSSRRGQLDVREEHVGEPHAGHDAHAEHGGGHDHHGGEHGDHAAMFRDRFWLTLLLTIPVVYYSEHLRHWFGYGVWEFPGHEWLSPVLGSVIFFYGGWPFLTGALSEARARKPGMMLLIGMAITVAYVASLATSVGLFTVEVWWELSLLIAIMLLGHWLDGAVELDESMITGEANPVPRGEAIPQAAGVLAPIGFVLPMAVGAILISTSTIIVALNAQLLRRVDLSQVAPA